MAPGHKAVLLLAAAVSVSAQISPINHYLSRPDIVSPEFYVHNYNPQLCDDGYIFITPNSPHKTNIQTAPYIYDNQGELVWSGYEVMDEGLAAFDEQVCNYQGAPHICVTQFQGRLSGGPGGLGSHHDIIDNTYSKIQSIVPNGNFANQPLRTDTHEFHIIGKPGKQTALVTSYITWPHVSHIPPHCGDSKETVPFTKTGFFQEVSTDGKNTVLFEWNAHDWVPTTESKVCPGQNPTTGTGQGWSEGYDYFHINSIDKDEDGNYLVSGRHVSTLYKVAGLNHPNPGSIIWRLSGFGDCDFERQSTVPGNPTLDFGYQHHARYDNNLPGADPSNEIYGITLWDNANSETDGGDKIKGYSSAKSILVDCKNKKATLIQEYSSPENQLDSSQGSHQTLSNRNHFLGLGSVNYMAEYTESGEQCFYASFGVAPIASYRSFRYPWKGYPKTKPDCFTYKHHCEGKLHFYVSWNGATEIDHWKFYQSDEEHGDYHEVGRASKSKFETHFEGTESQYGYAVACDKNGEPLGKTDVIEPYVPSEETVDQCRDECCQPSYDYCEKNRRHCHHHKPTHPSTLPTHTSTRRHRHSTTSPKASSTHSKPSHTKPVTTKPVSTTPKGSTTKSKPTSTKPVTTKPTKVSTTPKGSTTHKKPTSTKPVTSKPTTHKKPTSTKPVTTKPTKVSTTPKGSTTHKKPKPTSTKPVTSKPTTHKKPTSTKPVTTKPTTVSTKPTNTSTKPGTTKPTTHKKPTSTKPVTSKPTTSGVSTTPKGSTSPTVSTTKTTGTPKTSPTGSHTKPTTATTPQTKPTTTATTPHGSSSKPTTATTPHGSSSKPTTATTPHGSSSPTTPCPTSTSTPSVHIYSTMSPPYYNHTSPAGSTTATTSVYTYSIVTPPPTSYTTYATTRVETCDEGYTTIVEMHTEPCTEEGPYPTQHQYPTETPPANHPYPTETAPAGHPYSTESPPENHPYPTETAPEGKPYHTEAPPAPTYNNNEASSQESPAPAPYTHSVVPVNNEASAYNTAPEAASSTPASTPLVTYAPAPVSSAPAASVYSYTTPVTSKVPLASKTQAGGYPTIAVGAASSSFKVPTLATIALTLVFMIWF